MSADVEESFKYRLIDEYGINCYTENENRTLHFETYLTSYNELLIWVQSFGDGIKVIEPDCLRKDLLEKAKKIVELYPQTRHTVVMFVGVKL